MELKSKTVLIGAVVIAGLSYAWGRYATPAKIEIQTKEVVKTVQVETVKKKKVHVKIVRPDGTVEERWIDEDLTITEKSHETIKEVSKKISNEKPQYHLSGGTRYDQTQKEQQYSVGAGKRVWGPAFVDVAVDVDPSMNFEGVRAFVTVEF